MYTTNFNDLPSSVGILIVGAGPTGLALGTALRSLDTPALLIDNQTEGANTSRAVVVHARTLEVLEPLGIVPAILAEGIKVPTFRVRDRDTILMTVEFGELQTPYPYTVMIPQDRTEAILLERLRSLDGGVVRPVELVAIRPGADSVEADIVEDGARRTITARWLVGCDGAHSRVRDQAGISFGGNAYEEDFVLADVRMHWPIGRDEVTLFLSHGGMMLVAPLPPDRFRIVAAVEKAPEHPQLDYMQSIVDHRGPTQGKHQIHSSVWTSRFRIAHRLSATPHKGRVLLCGDAAHVHSPAGGQGMNLGIQDAVSLAGPLIKALQTRDGRELNGWAENRHNIAADVVSMTDMLTRAATIESIPGRVLRNAVLSLMGHLPGVPKAMAHRLAELESR